MVFELLSGPKRKKEINSMDMKPVTIHSDVTMKQMQEWRRGGRSEKTVILLFFSVVVTALVLSMALLSAGAAFPAPLPQTGGMSHGWQGRSARNNPDRELARLSRELKLSKDQKAKIKPIIEAEFQKMSSLRQNTSLSPQDRRTQFMDIRNKTMDQIRPLLTTEQVTKLQQMEQRREQRMRNWQSNHGQNAAPQSQ